VAIVTDENSTPPPTDSSGVDQPAPVTVVGYPDLPPAPSTASVPGLAGIRMAISTVRAIAIAALVLVVLMIVGAVLGFAVLRGQVSMLSAQVTALQDEQTQLLDRIENQPAPAAASEGQQQQQQGQSETSVAQLPAAPALPSGIPIPDGLDESGAVLVGDPNASNVVEVYLDYQCPYCQRWESEVGSVLTERALQPGSDLLVKHYVLAFLGETSPTLDPPGASARAASAALCVIEGEGQEAFTAFSEQVYASADPSEPASQFATEVLVDLAARLGVSDGTLECIDQERHVTFVALGTQTGFGRGVQGTPTVVVNGRTVESSFSDAELLALTR
jgi:protein-disulfide isomerase